MQFIQHWPFDCQEPDDSDGCRGDDPEEGRGVEAEVDHVADLRRGDVEVPERDGHDEDERANDGGQRVEVDQEHQTPVECSLHLKKKRDTNYKVKIMQYKLTLALPLC